MRIDVSRFSDHYLVRCLKEEDIPEILELCRKNTLFYQYCPPFVSEETILADMHALPPRKEYKDKYYLGYYEGDRLTAVMDLILEYPDTQTAFIGFFMTEISVQNRGIGSQIIRELCGHLKEAGFSAIRLGWVRGNPQAESFWHKNGFVETGVTYDTENYTVIVAQKDLGKE